MLSLAASSPFPPATSRIWCSCASVTWGKVFRIHWMRRLWRSWVCVRFWRLLDFFTVVATDFDVSPGNISVVSLKLLCILLMEGFSDWWLFRSLVVLGATHFFFHLFEPPTICLLGHFSQNCAQTLIVKEAEKTSKWSEEMTHLFITTTLLQKADRKDTGYTSPV